MSALLERLNSQQLSPARLAADRIVAGQRLAADATDEELMAFGLDRAGFTTLQESLQPGGATWDRLDDYRGSGLEARLLIVGASLERQGEAELAGVMRRLDAAARSSRAAYEQVLAETRERALELIEDRLHVLEGEALNRTVQQVFGLERSAKERALD